MSKLQESILLINLLAASTPEEIAPHLQRLKAMSETSQENVLRLAQMKIVVQVRTELLLLNDEKMQELQAMIPQLERLQPLHRTPLSSTDPFTLLGAMIHPLPEGIQEKADKLVDKAQAKMLLVDYIHEVLKEKTHPLLQEDIAIRKTMTAAELDTIAGHTKLSIALYEKIAEKPSLKSVIAKKHKP